MRQYGKWIMLGMVGLTILSCSSLPSMDTLKADAPLPFSPYYLGLLLALGTFISEDFSCITGGVLAAQGQLPFFGAVVACFLGIFVGDTLLFYIGKFCGSRVLKMFPLNRFLTESKIERGKYLLEKHGVWVVPLTRFLPGTRLATYLTAGSVGVHSFRFLLLFAFSCLLWTPLLVGFSFFFGKQFLQWFQAYERYSLILLLLLVLCLGIIWRGLVPLFSFRGRCLLLARWKRFVHWEFWPMYLFYIPIIFYVLWLGLRYRCFTLFTSTNPGMPQGGVALESKSAILTQLLGQKEQGQYVAKFIKIDQTETVEEKRKMLQNFMEKEQLSWPIVLKPDIGERGQGVCIADTPEKAEKFLEECPYPILLQEYISGVEYGVFYYRYPHSSRGEILSVTRKELPSIQGDGVRSLEKLILTSDRGLKMAPFFLKKFQERLHEVPAKGEKILLTQLGTHCRGSLFRDANREITETLRQRMDVISRPFEGFYFGRYDLKVSSSEALQRAEQLKILELNGVFSESTHIYDPKNSLWRAYRDLARQWKIAFEIGAMNRKSGKQPASLKEFCRLMLQYSKREIYEV